MVGKVLAQYQISEKIGEGGMGVVWKARDTHLDRFVALKTLSTKRLADPERRRRFVQEAKAASALNHPNIVHIYDIAEADGIQFIAMEYVPGKTLDQLIGRKGLRANEALKYAIQIADALARAHAAGIIHRDLKPSNLMVDDRGLVKVLDFGLAKLVETATGEFGATVTLRAGGASTEEGIIAGTTAYMSPEQAEGKKVDARSDIFSFGSVLYEMVTGRRAFHGDSKLSTLSAILKDDPTPVSSITTDVPRDLEKIIVRCLRKDPERRFQHMDDLKIALLELKEESDSGKLQAAAAAGTSGRRSRLRWAFAAMAVLPLAVLAAGYWLLRPASHSMPKIVPLTSYVGCQCCATFSPDGNQVAFVWDGPKHDSRDIYIKLIGTENALRLTNGQAAHSSPSWSPDGRYIAFVRFFFPNKFGVFLVPVIGGPDRKLAEIDSGGTLSWYPDGKWLAVSCQNSLCALSVNTGEKRKLTVPPPEGSDHDPAFSPDGRSLVFTRNFASGISELYVLALSTDLAGKDQPKQLTFKRQISKEPTWTADGREVIFDSAPLSGDFELWRTPATGRGPPQPLFVSEQGSTPAISRRGNRLAFTKVLTRRNIWRLEVPRFNRSAGEPVNLISSTYSEEAPQYSADGKNIAFTSARSGNWEVWVSASDGSNPRQITSLGAAGTPRWSPDGQRIIFDSSVEGQSELYMIDAGGGSPRRMTNHPADDAVASWSRDGRWLYFVSNRTKEWQIWKMPASGGKALQVTKRGGYVAFESADGKFVYFSRDIWQSSIWRVPVEGGEEEKVQDSVLGQAFAVARNGIYFASPNLDGRSTIQFHSFATGKVTTLASIRSSDVATPSVGWGLSVSPDERSLLYTQYSQASSSLMLVENFE